LVDDDQQTLDGLAALLRSEGLSNSVQIADARTVTSMLAAQPAGVIVLDLFMPHMPGETLLQTLTAEYPGVPVIVVTGSDAVDTAVRCMKYGAVDYIVKPVDSGRLMASIRNALARRSLEEENRRVRDKMLSPVLERPKLFEHIITRSPAMGAIFQYIEAIAEVSQPVLITGETGVGKELVARALHHASGRTGALVSVNVAGLDDTLFTDTLFGHTKGAFTNADTSREGLIVRAQGGTLLLDEIGDLSSASQVKLLRLLQEGEFFPVGSDTPRRSDARIIATTNAHLEELQTAGKFRKDLYYRLNAHCISVPPLREHPEDIPLLLDHFLKLFSQESGTAAPKLTPEVRALMMRYTFPGNIRELRSMVLDMVSRSKTGVPPLRVLEEKLGSAGVQAPHAATDIIIFPPVLPGLKETADALVAEALRRANGNKSAAARLLGISQQAVSKRCR